MADNIGKVVQVIGPVLDVEFAPARPLVQRLDVLQDMLEVVAAVIDQALGQAVKHERIVRIR